MIQHGQVIFVDVDDTIIDYNNKPKPQIIRFLKYAKRKDCKLYLWSQGGKEYAEAVADRLGIRDLFVACMDKPDICLDDLSIETAFSKWIHPIQLAGLDFD